MSSDEGQTSAVTGTQSDIYANAVAKIERSRRIEEGQAGAIVFAALVFGDALESRPLFAKAAHAAKLCCIAALFLIPNLLFLRVVL